MRNALTVLSLALFAFTGSAHAAAVSKSLERAAQKSFQGLKNQSGSQSLKGDRLHISSNGKTARVSIQAFGPPPGPLTIPARPSNWHDIKTSTFKKDAGGTWSKQGRWNTLFFAQ